MIVPVYFIAISVQGFPGYGLMENNSCPQVDGYNASHHLEKFKLEQ
jgi:hypothetical protein